MRCLLRDQGKDNDSIWESDIFGRKLSDLIRDGLNVKLSMIPEAARARLQDILDQAGQQRKGKCNRYRAVRKRPNQPFIPARKR